VDPLQSFKQEIINGIAGTFALLVSELEKSGSISKAEFATLVKTHAKAMPANPETGMPGDQRYETILLETLAAFLDGPKPSPSPFQVIPGGKADD